MPWLWPRELNSISDKLEIARTLMEETTRLHIEGVAQRDATIAAQAVEIERLRAALERIGAQARLTDRYFYTVEEARSKFEIIEHIVRNALKGE